MTQVVSPPAPVPRLFSHLFHIGEMTSAVLDLLNPFDLVTFSHTCVLAQKLVRERVIRRFIRFSCANFPTEHVAYLLNTIDVSGAAVVGSAALFTLANDWIHPQDDLPRDLNIITPRGTTSVWTAMFTGMATGTLTITRDSPPFLPRHSSTMNQVYLYHIWLTNTQSMSITVSESRTRSILGPLLSSEYTHQMVAVTSRYVVCAFPDTYRGVGARSMLYDGYKNPGSTSPIQDFSVMQSPLVVSIYTTVTARRAEYLLN
ncbi:hypothetical protein DFH06DRAFT_1350286 [Mycena polygramma]|nr:hypothetical protein DFH06DRAFT_1350286 [Mycena polygramma]